MDGTREKELADQFNVGGWPHLLMFRKVEHTARGIISSPGQEILTSGSTFKASTYVSGSDMLISGVDMLISG